MGIWDYKKKLNYVVSKYKEKQMQEKQNQMQENMLHMQLEFSTCTIFTYTIYSVRSHIYLVDG